MQLVIDLTSNAVVGGTTDPAFLVTDQQVLVDMPGGFEMAYAAEWAFNGVELVADPAAALGRAKLARQGRVKIEALTLIGRTDWLLQRARERETGGWGMPGEVVAVLSQREAIRRSSSRAEDLIDGLTDVDSVTRFSWSVDVPAPVSRRLTQTQFLDRFTDVEATSVLAATDVNVSLKLFWQKMSLADWIDLDEPATQAGVNALEIVGLLGAGRGAEILR